MKRPNPLSKELTVFIAGAAILVVGIAIYSSWAKDTIENYIGFAALSAGIVAIVFGIFKITEGLLQRIFSHATTSPRWLPHHFLETSPKYLFQNMKIAFLGVAVFLVGAITSGNWARFTTENSVGLWLLLIGGIAIVLGTAGVAVSYFVGLRYFSSKNRNNQLIIYGVAFFAIGSLFLNYWTKQSVEYYIEFGILTIGIFAMSFGFFRRINASIDIFLQKPRDIAIKVNKKSLFRSSQVIAFAIACLIVGLTIASLWVNISIQSYMGYGMLLAGTIILLSGHIGIVASFMSPRLIASRNRQALIGKLETLSLESAEDEPTKHLILELETKMVIQLKDKETITVRDLAYNLSISSNLTRKILQRVLAQNKVNGYLTIDDEKYFSADGLRKSLTEVISRN